MSSSSKPNKKKITGNTVVVNIGCGCRRPKLAAAFRPKPKPKPPSHQNHHHHKPNLYRSSSTSSCDRSVGIFSINDKDDYTTTSFSPYLDTTTPPTHSEPEPEQAGEEEETHFNSNTIKGGFGRIGESVAVVKDSDDPYLDFRQSMLQMILEKELYSREDLRDLLDRFLQLNSPYHHEIIVRAFSEIWNGLFSSVKQRYSSSGLASDASATSLKPRSKSREF
ncbi:transcription repressor OFP8-like [Macadamia integrifolia]|uniref:transcription repressor OFP8-like n=1 Tax=Macadamia integrifolia TaxID=60698 RepID=UPI001C4EF39C|nr:transcription repressor OFP8-like [Macadamia integrifolia]